MPTNYVELYQELEDHLTQFGRELPGPMSGCARLHKKAVKGIARPPTNLQTLADRLKVLAEPKRLLILHLLMEGVQCNCELGDALQMPPTSSRII